MEGPPRAHEPLHEHAGVRRRRARGEDAHVARRRGEAGRREHRVREQLPAVPVRGSADYWCVVAPHSSLLWLARPCFRPRKLCLTGVRFGWADDDGASWGSGDALGTISLRVVPVQAVAKKAKFRPTSFAGVGAVHERSKKAGAHCVS